MSCYWDNSSIFRYVKAYDCWTVGLVNVNMNLRSLDLVGAVIRQGTFIEKMHAIDWLHSPVLGATIDRLLVKYTRFFHIMGTYSDQVAVPTLVSIFEPQSPKLATQSICAGILLIFLCTDPIFG